MVSLSSEDVEMVQAHLRCKVEPSGEGCTVKPDVFKGLRGLVALGVGDLLLYAGDYKKLFAERAEVFIHCDAKTITRAFRSIARDTDLVVRVGRRWLFRGGDLQLEDSELLRAIRARTPITRDGAQTSVAKDSAPAASRLGHGSAPRSTASRVHGADDRAPHDAEPGEVDPRPGAPPEMGRFDATPPEAAIEDEPEPDLQPQDPVSRRSRIQFRIYQPLPAEQAASRYEGRKKGRGREPPKP